MSSCFNNALKTQNSKKSLMGGTVHFLGRLYMFSTFLKENKMLLRNVLVRKIKLEKRFPLLRNLSEDI